MSGYSYKESLRIMLTPYIFLTLFWVPMTLLTEEYLTEHPLKVMFVVDNIATSIVFVFSLYYRNTSIYDPYWHIPPLKILLYFVWKTNQPWSNQHSWVLSLPLLYFCRHNLNYFSFWPGMQYEDFRYIRFRKSIKQPILFWIFSYTGLHLVPTLMVLFGLFPTWYALAAEETPNQVIFFAGVVISLFGIGFESIADLQLYPWRSRKTSEYIDEGLWRYSRHPNYFGECIFWWGTFINAISFGQHYWPTVIGAVFIQSVFVFYSIPVMEDHLIQKRPSYENQIQRVSKFVPWFRKEIKVKQ